uniref:RING-CH-type domain-containing protein n=1 Tax=Macrostomum lignano TaxID=282301 RepID=A0A1I8GM65_9PLAT
DTLPNTSSPIVALSSDAADAEPSQSSPIISDNNNPEYQISSNNSDRRFRQQLVQSQASGTPAAVFIGSSFSSPHCRYCLGGRSLSLNCSDQADDHRVGESLVGPCLCKGTMGLVHPGCLTRWLQLSRKHRCELCGFDLRQCDQQLMPELAQAAADAAAAAAAARSEAAAEAATTAAQGEASADGSSVAPNWCTWLRQPDQEETKQSNGYQLVLFELLTGFVSVGVIIWIVYGAATCWRRYQSWRMELTVQREMTVIVALEEGS